MKKIIIGATVFVLALALLITLKPNNSEEQSDKNETISRLQDAHGLAVDRENPSKVYIATHRGLLAMIDDNELVQVSDDQDDYMGFSAHPTETSIFYSSGHSSRGGNIGFQRSTDGGKTWEKISAGADGPVDFHAMAVSWVDPNIVYGTYQGQLQRSTNEGKDWQIIQTAPSNIYTLATSSDNSNVLYAGTSEGLQISSDKGNTWSGLNLAGTITTVSVNPSNSENLVVNTVDSGLMMTVDGGKTWDNIDSYSGDLVMYLVHDPQDADVMYLINKSLEIYKTTDSAKNWSKIR